MTDQSQAIAASPGPFSSFEWLLAGRYLRSRRKEAFISVITGFSFLGILLGVATLIVVMSVMNGFRTELLDRILGLNGHIIVNPLDGPLNDYPELSERFMTVDGVTHAIPLVEGQALVGGTTGTGGGALVRGMREADIKSVETIARGIEQGTLEGFDDGDGVVVGYRLANNLGLGIGDGITLITPDGDVTPFGKTPRVKTYPVSAIFNIGMSEYDGSFVFMPLEESQIYFNKEDRVDVIDIFIEDADAVNRFREPLENAAGRLIFLSDWRNRNASLTTALEVERNVMFMILTLIVLVAALNIISGLIMLVKDKSHDIAILRTMGITRASIMRVFMMTGSAIGVVGTLAGLVVGIIFTLNIQEITGFFSWIAGRDLWDPTTRFLTEIPARLDFWEIVSIVAMALTISFLATLFPAWRASSLDPVEALRYE